MGFTAETTTTVDLLYFVCSVSKNIYYYIMFYAQSSHLISIPPCIASPIVIQKVYPQIPFFFAKYLIKDPHNAS